MLVQTLPPPEAKARRDTIILCQGPSADWLGGIGKAQHTSHGPVRIEDRSVGKSCPTPRDLDILCPRHTSQLPKTSARMQEDSSALAKRDIYAARSAGCGVIRSNRYIWFPRRFSG